MARHPGTGRTAKPASFFWQGLCILLPVAILAGLGLWTLRRDRSFAEQEARERAEALAQEAAGVLQAALAGDAGSNTHPAPAADGAPEIVQMDPSVIRVDSQGRLWSPKPYSLVPNSTGADWTGLNADQTKSWREAEFVEYALGDFASAAQLQNAFLSSKPPVEWETRAHYSLGLLLLKQGKTNSAIEQFRAARAVGSTRARTDSGIPIQHLAQFRLQEMGAMSGEHSEVADRILLQAAREPSVLSRELLASADRLGLKPPVRAGGNAIQTWTALWQMTESQRALYDSLLEGEPAQDLVAGKAWRWVGTVAPHLVQRREDAQGIYRLRCLTPERVREIADSIFGSIASAPPYLGMSLSVAGREVIPANSLRELERVSLGKGGGQGWVAAEPRITSAELTPPQVLATCAKFENGQPILAVNVHLISPGMLYERVESRRLGFLGLIGASVLAALAGFLTARRAFLQQLKLSDLKTNFVSSVSHELRAPIASLRLMAERLESGRVEEAGKQREYFRFIVQECRRLGTMIENVLDFSRIERGQKSYEFEPTDLVALLENSIKLMDPAAAQREIRLRTIVQGSPLPACVDGLALQQVMLNLIDNAIKHSPAKGEVEVGLGFPAERINAGHGDASSPRPDSTMLRLWVADHGEGIPKAEHERIFERFYRCGSELRRTTQGVGIGLSIVKHVVEAHGGRVTVESEPGAGSRFEVSLPMRMNA